MRSVYRAMRARRIQQPKHPAVRFQPLALFKNNEPGVWYDPSDLSTLFQNSAGTTPVTAVEQPVGLMLDKSKGLVLGSELVTNGDFSSGTTGWALGPGWAISGGVASKTGSISSNITQQIGHTPGKFYQVTVDFSGYNTANLVYFGVGGAYSYAFPLTASGTFKAIILAASVSNDTGVRCIATAAITIDNISVRELPGNHASQTTTTSRPVLSARVNQYLATETLATQNITTLAAQYRLSFEGTGTITLSGTATGVYSAGSHLITCTAGTLTSTVSGSVTKADLRVANTGVNLPPYQRVNTATDYDADPAKFPHYLRFDGSDDWLVTPTITPNTDKVQVFAGVRKLSDAAQGVAAELSVNRSLNAGSFTLLVPNLSNEGNYAFLCRGTNSATVNTTGYTAPITNILTGLGDISGDTATLRVNGSQAAQSTADQGTGNYLAYPLYIGRRGGTTLPFNGHLYSLIVRFGANLPTATIENTENYINQKTRAF